MNAREAQARAMIAEKSLELIPYGSAWWITGRGVDVIVADLAYISPKDLDPRVGPNFEPYR